MKLDRYSQGLEEAGAGKDDVSSTVSFNKSCTSRPINLDQRLGHPSLQILKLVPSSIHGEQQWFPCLHLTVSMPTASMTDGGESCPALKP